MKAATMLGRKHYTREEIGRAKAALDRQLAAYKGLVKAVASATTDEKGDAAVESFDAPFFNNMTLVLHLSGRSLGMSTRGGPALLA
jgi:hypothetical protein